MNHIIDIKTLKELNNEEYHILYHMNMGSDGQMQFRLAQYDKRRKFRNSAWAVIHYDELGFINGWCLLFKDFLYYHQSNPEQIVAYFFVPQAWRGKGIGSALLDAARLVEPEPFVVPWDKTSGKFFSKKPGIKIDFWNDWVDEDCTATRV